MIEKTILKWNNPPHESTGKNALQNVGSIL